ncbi:glycoside hydrolase family 3 N-terminal domain-containing protein [Cohnella sp. GCM10012308]|uniref:glycoside hydrolase family 3 N-terminal domain-containing protein n=1 Tax=Cohnella sp. GCM10012308 TaxID=3317329 RepID=UPI0036223378
MRYRDSKLPVDARVSDLLARMTTEEKIGQLVQPFGWRGFDKGRAGWTMTEAFRQDVREGRIGALYGMQRADPWTQVTLENGLTPRAGAEAANEVQRCAIEESRLGIPLLMGEECSHGHMAIGGTVFPVPLSIGSTWSPELHEEICRAVAAETRNRGGHVTYSPVLDVVRDPRWGRTEETFGEDPYLVGEFGAASVRGYQGERLDAEDSIGATLKHFVAYGSSEGGRNGAPVHMGPLELQTIDLPPFRKAIEAGALSLMPAYNEIDGVPCTSNRHLLEDVVRREWGFNGFVITDCGAIDMLASGHNVADGNAEASALALNAGVDMEMSGSAFRANLAAALEEGLVTEEPLDLAAGRVLAAKFRLGLFERPYADPAAAEAVVGRPEHLALAKRAAAEGTVLLKNEGGLLPLSREGLRSVAVIGPNADAMYHQLGDYTAPQPRGSVSTVLDGVRAKLAGTSAEVLFAPGCRVRGESREGFEAALAAADKAEAVVLVLGGSSARDFGEGTIDLRTGASIVRTSGESDMDCGEGIDRAALGLSGVQAELAREIHALGKPLIVVYVNGRPIVEPWIDDNAAAILEAWYPGQMGGEAIADLLFGDAAPSGRLSVTIPRHAGQLPLTYNGKRTRGKRYLETELAPRYPFGFGLGYTTFEYADIELDKAVLADGEEAIARVKVTNTGEREGIETVQLYVTDLVSSVSRPEWELKGFRKIKLAPGQTETVTFALGFEQLALTMPDGRRLAEPGGFVVRIGPDSSRGPTAELQVKKGG